MPSETGGAVVATVELYAGEDPPEGNIQALPAEGPWSDTEALVWAGDADLPVNADDLEVLERCYERLVEVRVGLHRVTGRPGDVLRLEVQDAVAEEVGAPSADELMATVSAAARAIVWITDGAWRHLRRHQVRLQEQHRADLGAVCCCCELPRVVRRPRCCAVHHLHLG